MTPNPQPVINAIIKKVEQKYNVNMEAYPDQSKPGYINMEKIIAHKQGEGEGTKALKLFTNLCKSAGFKGITISAHPLTGFRMTTTDDIDRLIKWYSSHGFVIARMHPIQQMELKFR